MNRRLFLAGCVLALAPLPALAESLPDRVIRQLKAQGFTRFKVSRTWLGRTRIIATSPTQSREIILNPRTGEILRDYWHARDDAKGSTTDDDAVMDSRNDDSNDGPDNDGPDNDGSSGGGGGSDNDGEDGRDD